MHLLLHDRDRNDIFALQQVHQHPGARVQPARPSPGANAFELQILPNGDVLVADSRVGRPPRPRTATSSRPTPAPPSTVSSSRRCADELFASPSIPSGTSFWTDDAFSGNIWQVDIATGQVCRRSDELALPLRPLGRSTSSRRPRRRRRPPLPTVPHRSAPSRATSPRPTPVSAVLTNPNTGTPIVNEPVTFTLNGSETCTATTDATGTATCDITASEPSSSYTLTASFPGDTTTSTPIGSDSSIEHVHGQSGHQLADLYRADHGGERPTVTLVGTLTTDTPTHGHAAADQGGHLHHRLGLDGPVLQRDHRHQRERQLHDPHCRPAADDETITSTFAGDTYDTPVDGADRRHGHRTDDADGQPGHGRLRGRHHGVRRAHRTPTPTRRSPASR